MSAPVSMTTTGQRTQSMSSQPTQQTVRVAVLPPRLPPDMAPPTGLGPSDNFNWDERLNWLHNETIDGDKDTSRRKSILGKVGYTRERKKRHDTPPFLMREVPYDVWRNHYAKDAEGNYCGLLAPAEDCLLKPHDVAKWSADAPKTKGDQWTRGSAVLPVYEQVDYLEEVPKYTKDPADATLDSTVRPSAADRTPSTFTADGKTSTQIIEDARIKAAEKTNKQKWREALSAGVKFTMGS